MGRGSLATVLGVNWPLPPPHPRFVAYKLPHHSPGQGLRYHYLDARRGDWVSGRALINSSQGALGTTLRQLYQAATTVSVGLGFRGE